MVQPLIGFQCLHHLGCDVRQVADEREQVRSTCAARWPFSASDHAGERLARPPSGCGKSRISSKVHGNGFCCHACTVYGCVAAVNRASAKSCGQRSESQDGPGGPPHTCLKNLTPGKSSKCLSCVHSSACEVCAAALGLTTDRHPSSGIWSPARPPLLSASYRSTGLPSPGTSSPPATRDPPPRRRHLPYASSRAVRHGLLPPSQVAIYQAIRREPFTASKCLSQLTMGSRCSLAKAAIQQSLAGMGVPSALSCRRISA